MNWQRRWQTFSAAPHRMMFFAGSLSLLLSVVWWLLQLLNQSLLPGWLPAPPLAPMWLHGLLMGYGLFSFFIFGFLMTTFPRWLSQPALSKPVYASAALLMLLGYLLLLLGVQTRMSVIAVALMSMLAGWGVALVALARVLVAARQRVNHAWITLTALALGWLGLLLFLVGALLQKPALIELAIQMAVWLYLLPIYLSISHRMIPFFSQNVAPNYVLRRPNWALYALLAAVVTRFLLAQIGWRNGLWLPDLPLFGIALYLAILWQPWKCRTPRILSSLHLGFAWLPLALALFLLQDLWWWLHAELILPRAPLHALGIGYFGSLLTAMATRVSLGHSGNPLHMDRSSWLLFLGIQLTAMVRVLAELPIWQGLTAMELDLLAAILWLGFLAPWVIKYAPLYLRPRRDGQPG